LIKLVGVSKLYPRGPAVDKVSFHVRKGEFAFLTGHSGAGKSTLLRLIHMAEAPTEGEVRVSGFSSLRTSQREVWKLRRRVGYVFQDFRLLEGRTAMDNVGFALEVTDTPPGEIVPRSQRLLARVGLSARAGQLVDELSGGERQRVAIARALVHDPLILLADEPTGNLDERAARGIIELFRDLNEMGMAVLMATHHLELVREQPRAHVIEMDTGKLVFDSAVVPAPPPPADA
jgi:cell division transport system ATP-binding protein